MGTGMITYLETVHAEWPDVAFSYGKMASDREGLLVNHVRWRDKIYACYSFSSSFMAYRQIGTTTGSSWDILDEHSVS